jgi:hypothetical protein
MDKRYPWVGLGLIDDLKCASRELGGDPDKQYPDMRKPEAGASFDTRKTGVRPMTDTMRDKDSFEGSEKAGSGVLSNTTRDPHSRGDDFASATRRGRHIRLPGCVREIHNRTHGRGSESGHVPEGDRMMDAAPNTGRPRLDKPRSAAMPQRCSGSRCKPAIASFSKRPAKMKRGRDGRPCPMHVRERRIRRLGAEVARRDEPAAARRASQNYAAQNRPRMMIRGSPSRHRSSLKKPAAARRLHVPAYRAGHHRRRPAHD